MVHYSNVAVGYNVMNRKFLIPHRPGGIAELHFGLLGTYYICQQTNRDLIFDATWSIYNRKKEVKNEQFLGSRGYNINLWKALYKKPHKINNVEFYNPEEFPELYVNDDQPHYVNSGAIAIADHNKQNTMKEIFLNNNYRFIYNTYRIGVGNVIWPEMASNTLIDYYDFFNQFEYSYTFKEQLDFYLKKYFNNQFIIGIHIRQSSEKELGNAAFPPFWFTKEKIIPIIEKYYKQYETENPKLFLCTDCPNLNSELLEHFGDRMFTTNKIDIGKYNIIMGPLSFKNNDIYTPRTPTNIQLISSDCSNHQDKDGFAYYDFLYSALDNILLAHTNVLLCTNNTYFTYYANCAYKAKNNKNIHYVFEGLDKAISNEYTFNNKKYTFGVDNPYRWSITNV